MRRLLIGFVALLAGIFGFHAPPAIAAPSTTIEITDVYNAVDPKEEWLQIYNMTRNAMTLEGWKVCASDTCVDLPTTKVEPFSLAKIKSTSLNGWPANGLNGTADMVGLLDEKGTPVDSMNWGTPSDKWKNYATFQPLLWNPGVKAPDAATNQSYFRMAIGNDTDKPADWLTTSSKPAVPATAVPTPAPTKAPDTGGGTGGTGGATGGTGGATGGSSGSTTGGTTGGSSGATAGAGGGTQPATGTTTPQTGGEFPFLLAIVLVAVVLTIRYARRGFNPRGTRG